MYLLTVSLSSIPENRCTFVESPLTAALTCSEMRRNFPSTRYRVTQFQFPSQDIFVMIKERDGSLVVLPLKNRSRRVFGVISIDTVNDPPGKTYQQHEISFYQVHIAHDI